MKGVQADFPASGRAHPRELEVLEWLAAGYTAEAIAKELGATPRTIQTHIHNLKAKTGARTQLEAVRMAHDKAAVAYPMACPPERQREPCTGGGVGKP